MADGMRLNIGCGKDIREGWLDCDFVAEPEVDRVFDASKQFPFQDESIDEILMSHVLEHIFNWLDTLLECHRVLRKGGRIEIRVPYGVGWHNADPHHVRFFWPGTMTISSKARHRVPLLWGPLQRGSSSISRN